MMMMMRRLFISIYYSKMKQLKKKLSPVFNRFYCLVLSVQFNT